MRMRSVLYCCILVSLSSCGSSDDSKLFGKGGTSSGGTSASGGGGTSSGGTSAGGTSAGGTSAGGTSAGGAGGASGSGGGGGTTACGASLVCDASSVCIVDEKSAKCTALVDDAGTCPAGQTKSQCGGIGYPCCCEPPPPSEYRCESASACTGTPDCNCLGNVCKNGQMCMGIGGKAHEFHCADPPVP